MIKTFYQAITKEPQLIDEELYIRCSNWYEDKNVAEREFLDNRPNFEGEYKIITKKVELEE